MHTLPQERSIPSNTPMGDRLSVRFLHNYTNHVVGDMAVFERDIALQLCRKGLADINLWEVGNDSNKESLLMPQAQVSRLDVLEEHVTALAEAVRALVESVKPATGGGLGLKK